MDEFCFGAGFNTNRGVLVSGGLGAEPPWPVEVAWEVFEGRTELAYLTVLAGGMEAPTGFAALDPSGGAEVAFLDELGRKELSYTFSVSNEVCFVEEGTLREGCLFLTHVHRFRYTGELDRYGSPAKLETVSRMNRNDGFTMVNLIGRIPKIDGYVDPRVDWWDDPEVDVAADGFWEPAPTWGDWDRWFVRDRPGVKLFD